MCHFKSAIVLRDESSKGGFKLLMSPYTESHSDLCRLHKLNDGGMLHFARVEFSPKCTETADQVDTYSLRIDEERTPEWFNEIMKADVAERMAAYIRSIIISGEADILLGGQYILTKDARVGTVNCAVVQVMFGGTLNEMFGGTINKMCGGTLNNMWCGTLNEMFGGTINDMRGGTINDMWGGTLNKMWGGTLNEMFGGTINKMCGGTLNDMRGGTINEITDGYSPTIKAQNGGTIVKDGRPAVAEGKPDNSKKKRSTKKEPTK